MHGVLARRSLGVGRIIHFRTRFNEAEAPRAPQNRNARRERAGVAHLPLGYFDPIAAASAAKRAALPNTVACIPPARAPSARMRSGTPLRGQAQCRAVPGRAISRLTTSRSGSRGELRGSQSSSVRSEPRGHIWRSKGFGGRNSERQNRMTTGRDGCSDGRTCICRRPRV